jgi:hypothetical protein
MSSVYLETSFFSECCTIRTSEIARGRRALMPLTDEHGNGVKMLGSDNVADAA